MFGVPPPVVHWLSCIGNTHVCKLYNIIHYTLTVYIINADSAEHEMLLSTCIRYIAGLKYCYILLLEESTAKCTLNKNTAKLVLIVPINAILTKIDLQNFLDILQHSATSFS